MFTKERIIKVFRAINFAEANRRAILNSASEKFETRTDEDRYLIAFTEKLVTDEVVKYINKHSFKAAHESHGEEEKHTLCCIGWWGIRPSNKKHYQRQAALYIYADDSGSSLTNVILENDMFGAGTPYFDKEFQKMFPEECRGRWSGDFDEYSECGDPAKGRRLLHRMWDY